MGALKVHGDGERNMKSKKEFILYIFFAFSGIPPSNFAFTKKKKFFANDCKVSVENAKRLPHHPPQQNQIYSTFNKGCNC